MKDLSIYSTRGFSLVELMVAVAIGLIATVVIFQVFAVSEGVKRTSTSGGDAQQNGSLALFSIGRDVRMAGYGINNVALLGCTIRAYDETQTPPDLPELHAHPLEITVGATARDPDSVSVMYSQSDLVAFSAQFLMDQGRRMPSTRSISASALTPATWSSPPNRAGLHDGRGDRRRARRAGPTS
jgi:prepilin-type N-terminal cleavage/methylation domain-containing protein